MEIKQIRILTSKVEDPNDKEKQIDVLTVALLHEDPTPKSSDDAEVKDIEFATMFPVQMFNSPAGYALAIEHSFAAFRQHLEKLSEPVTDTTPETLPE